MRYAVLDAHGLVVNTILVIDPFPPDYFPGYGVYLIGADTAAPAVEGRGDVLTLAVEKPVSQGDTIDFLTGAVSRPVPAPPSADALRAYASGRRWEIETGGITVNGVSVPTDDRAKTMIGRAARTTSSVASTPYIVNGTNYGSLTKAQFAAIDAAIDEHIAFTFERLAVVLAGIESGAITSYAAVNAEFLA